MMLPACFPFSLGASNTGTECLGPPHPMIELEIHDPANPSRPSWSDWIEEEDLDDCRRRIKEAGLAFSVTGPVSWQRQLARMENNPE